MDTYYPHISDEKTEAPRFLSRGTRVPSLVVQLPGPCSESPPRVREGKQSASAGVSVTETWLSRVFSCRYPLYVPTNVASLCLCGFVQSFSYLRNSRSIFNIIAKYSNLRTLHHQNYLTCYLLMDFQLLPVFGITNTAVAEILKN